MSATAAGPTRAAAALRRRGTRAAVRPERAAGRGQSAGTVRAAHRGRQQPVREDRVPGGVQNVLPFVPSGHAPGRRDGRRRLGCQGAADAAVVDRVLAVRAQRPGQVLEVAEGNREPDTVHRRRQQPRLSAAAADVEDAAAAKAVGGRRVLSPTETEPIGPGRRRRRLRLRRRR